MTGKIEKVRAVKNKYEKEWLGTKGVAAVGIGQIDDKLGIIISTDENINPASIHIPAFVDGIPVKIQTSGTLRAL